jgi:hypothetical protein
MAKNAWSFAHYTCGHSTPVRGGDRNLPYPCPDCPRLCAYCRTTNFRTDSEFCSEDCEAEATS